MYVCVCRQVTDRQIRELCRGGKNSLSEVRARLGVASECGKCTKFARTILNEFNRPVSDPVVTPAYAALPEYHAA
ncbi:MAG: (2Fe-2S)-binding protein [Pseudohongiellaceae bacterium]